MLMLTIAGICVFVIALIGFFSRRKQIRINHELCQKYTSIYRIISISGGVTCPIVAHGSSINIGDFGWEAEPINNDGLIYLHGLNRKWQVVWYAGFNPDQIELVGPKPKSQYYIFPDWMAASQKIPECPFPVKKYSAGKIYKTDHFGFPVKIDKDWVQGVSIRIVKHHTE